VPLIPTNGTRLNALSAGEGEDVVMVHGLAANLAFWRLKIVPHLVDRYRITAYDLRGHGRSDMPESGYSPVNMASDLEGLLDAMGIEQAHLVGHSFGGGVVLEFAVRHPRRVRSLTLADATIYSLQPLDRGRDWSYWRTWRQTLGSLGIQVPRRLPKVAFSLLEEIADPRWMEARQRWRQESGSSGSDYFVPFGLWNGARRTAERWTELLRTTQAWSEFQSPGVSVEEIGRLTLPTLLAYGERSRWLRTAHRLGEALQNSETLILPNVGHFFPLLNPMAFVVSLRAFLDRTRSSWPATTLGERYDAPASAVPETPAAAGRRAARGTVSRDQ